MVSPHPRFLIEVVCAGVYGFVFPWVYAYMLCVRTCGGQKLNLVTLACFQRTSSSPFQLSWLGKRAPHPHPHSQPLGCVSALCCWDSGGWEPHLAFVWVLGELNSDPHVGAASTDKHLTTEPSSSSRISVSWLWSPHGKPLPESDLCSETRSLKKVLSLTGFNAFWCVAMFT